MANRFVSNQLITIDLGDGDWVKVPEQVSYEFMTDLYDTPALQNASNSRRSIHLLSSIIKEWNLKENGVDVPVTPENVARLDVATVNTIMTVVAPKLNIDPKEQAPSDQPSEVNDQIPSSPTM